ncbi:MAG TPA: Gfo/Idh/MocA family oxidoreductase [Bryobacteraceae bacterium]|nr:Gfo/Idh/MocA family oxidoreductase [Bryobacteraceae bacterium]
METNRRNFLQATGAAFTTSLFTGNVRGANDKIAVGFIGMGKMGRSNLKYALQQENVVVPAVCDVYDRNLNWAVDIAKGQALKGGARGVRDFRDVLADKSIDAVCIATPDHWHPYMTVEACKAGKDVYVEKPICTVADEAPKMVEAARKYNRVVQAGTMQRSAVHFQHAVEAVRGGKIGKVTFVRTWNYSNDKQEGIGNPPDQPPPAGLDWDMWLGPAPQREFNPNRFGVDPKDKYFSRFRWFWDYAGGMMTDWGVHWLDIVQMAFQEEMPRNITALGGKFWLTDDRETPDTLQVTYEYPSGFLAVYENRDGNAQSMFQKGGGILFHGTEGTLFVDRSEFHIVPERGSDLEPSQEKSTSSGNALHWQNFLECIRTRQRPISDIEKCAHSTTTCLLGNVALRSQLRLDWDVQQWTVEQAPAKKFLTREYRSPWNLTV